ncbi:dopamine receptor 1 [Caerostris extrusa]|uniref:Dopamine receptor 1 n=1 Tax=Caerostris extrusa TaxID=172846 RepID=A0AAV4NEK6_CAEEX|nr:dopamine receptor 1 [Caerostris extrusa]
MDDERVVLMAIGGIWMLSALVSFLPISLGWHKPKKISESLDEELRPTCALDLTPVYAVVSSIISFYAPCVVMVALYTRLYLYARKHVRNIRAVTKTTISSKQTGSKSCNSNHNHHNMDHKAAITLGFIMGTFLVCWVPFFCINIVAAVCKSCISDMRSFQKNSSPLTCRQSAVPYLSVKDTSRERSDTRRTTLGPGHSNHLRPPSSPLNPDPINRIEMQGEWSGKSSDV